MTAIAINDSEIETTGAITVTIDSSSNMTQEQIDEYVDEVNAIFAKLTAMRAANQKRTWALVGGLVLGILVGVLFYQQDWNPIGVGVFTTLLMLGVDRYFPLAVYTKAP